MWCAARGAMLQVIEVSKSSDTFAGGVIPLANVLRSVAMLVGAYAEIDLD